jgi:hypothetical protein
MAAHRQIAEESVNQADRVVREARERRQSQIQEQPLEECKQQAHSALTFARDRSFEREAVMDERALFVDAMRRGMGETTYPEVRASFEARVASGESTIKPASSPPLRQSKLKKRSSGRCSTARAALHRLCPFKRPFHSLKLSAGLD